MRWFSQWFKASSADLRVRPVVRPASPLPKYGRTLRQVRLLNRWVKAQPRTFTVTVPPPRCASNENVLR